jgi:hypothetical protein
MANTKDCYEVRVQAMCQLLTRLEHPSDSRVAAAGPHAPVARLFFLRCPTVPEWSDRYGPCDHASLQLFCLTECHYSRCILYPARDSP